jgi:hypothetical protein
MHRELASRVFSPRVSAFPFFETKSLQANAFEGITLGEEYERRTDVD